MAVKVLLLVALALTACAPSPTPACYGPLGSMNLGMRALPQQAKAP